MPEMDHNRVWNHQQDGPRISSEPADIATRAVEHPSSNFIPTFPSGFAALPGTSNNLYMNTYNGNSVNFPPNQAPNLSACYSQPVRGDGLGTIYPQMDYRRVAFKRKSPVIPQTFAGTNTSGYSQVGSSSSHPPYPTSIEATVSPTPECYPLNTINMPASYRNDNNIHGEGPLRNVRSRHSEQLHSQFNPAWLCASRDVPYALYPSCNTSDPRMTEQWNHFPPPVIPQGWYPTLDDNSLNQRLNQPTARSNIIGGTAASNSSYPSHLNQNPPLSTFHYPTLQNTVPIQSGHNHSVMSHNTGSIYPGSEASAASVSGVPVGVEPAAPSRYLRALPVVGHTGHGGHRSARNAHQRSLLIFTGHNPHSRWAPEAALVADWSAFYDSMHLLDHHRDMRMDIDNMSYEELLALEERIGIVSTGLSTETVSRCLVETTHRLSQQIQQGKCAICLEEYSDGEKLGKLNCDHDFHVSCISQWLQMKNVCPICRESAFGDALKKK